jgi:uncharacterized membrane protein
VNKLNIVWSAVVSATLASVGIIMASAGLGESAMAAGLASIAFAILSTKE